MQCKMVCQLTSYLLYPAILVPEAINPERAISYAMQNRAPTYKYPVILVHVTTLREKLEENPKCLRQRARQSRQWACEKPLNL